MAHRLSGESWGQRRWPRPDNLVGMACFEDRMLSWRPWKASESLKGGGTWSDLHCRKQRFGDNWSELRWETRILVRTLLEKSTFLKKKMMRVWTNAIRMIRQVISTGFYDQLEVTEEESGITARLLVWVAGWLMEPVPKIRNPSSFSLPAATADLQVSPFLMASASHRETLHPSPTPCAPFS